MFPTSQQDQGARTNMPPLGKRKKRQEDFQRCYELAVQQLGPRQPHAPPTVRPPSGSLPQVAPPLIRRDEPDPNAPTPPEAEGPLISARRALPKEGSEDAPPSKKVKGLVKGLKAEDIVRRTGKKIEIKFNDFVHGPESKDLNSLLTKDIGRIIRTSVAMNQPTWWQLDEDERLKLCTGLSVCYEIDYEQRMFDWLMKAANKTYTTWKAKLNLFFKHFKGTKAPKEFVLGGRMDEWNWLKQHFQSPEFLKRSVANTANRDKLAMHHHSGCTPFIYNADKLRREGESLYLIGSYEKVYDAANNEIAAGKARDMRVKVLDMVNKQREQQPDTPEDELLRQVDLQSQLNVFEKVLGTKGMNIKGLGRVQIVGKDAATRHSRPNDRVMEEVREHARLAQEEAQRAQEEAQQAREQARLAQEKNLEYECRLRQLEEFMFSQSGRQPELQQPQVLG